MAHITRVDISMIELKPKVERKDAIQSFIAQETPIVTIYDSDGVIGKGYSYTIGTGGHSIITLLERSLAPMLIGRDPDCIEQIWRDLLFSTHATSVGAITSLAIAAIDIALWDLRCKKMDLPLWKLAGGFKDRIPLYTTEGGWLHLETSALVDDAQAMQEKGFKGSKIKIGKEHISQDDARLGAVRAAVGDGYEIMTDGNQGFNLSEAIRRTRMLESHGVSWFEEPMPADDLTAHVELSRHSSVPIAVGESLYSLSQFKDYLQMGAASIVQVDVARIGGITPWLKVAHMAEAFNVMVSPHFLMELHLSLVCAVPNAKWLEYIPQLDDVTQSKIKIHNGVAFAPQHSGIGIDWDEERLKKEMLVLITITGD
ncbi:MAG: mandelate racemase/muconate lactonizing enzyme family protein [Pseudomonadales bacterium]|jgi:L-alanine-DL-glutamate epimerase-like enolase superfamily enzyme|tara:strand:+ start:4525 stop:5634 length:1110 start_codon:yes stop_codon:yes gene_type:complete